MGLLHARLSLMWCQGLFQLFCLPLGPHCHRDIQPPATASSHPQPASLTGSVSLEELEGYLL